VCLHFSVSCLFTFLSFQLFVFFFSVFVNKRLTLFTFFQLFVYNSAVCLLFLSFCKQTADFSAKIRFWLFWTKLTPVQRQYPFSVFVNKQLTLFTFFSCLFTFCQLFVYILSAVCLLFLSFQLFVYFFFSVSAVCLHFCQLFVYILSAVCLLFSVFVNKQLTSQFSAVCLHFFRFWLFWTKLTPVQRQYPFSVFVNKQLTLFTFSQFSAVCLHSQSAVCLHFSVFVNKQLIIHQNLGFDFFERSWP
jgi:hypothetical protein